MYLSKHKIAVFALILTTIIWSAAAPIYKWSLVEMPPFTFGFYRFLLSALIMLPFVYRKLHIRSEDFYKLLILSLTGITLQNALLFVGLTLAPSINVPIISSMIPIFLIIAGVIFLKEHPQLKVLIGTTISLIGVLIIIVRPNDGITSTSILGNLYIVLSVLLWVWYTILLKEYRLKYSLATVIFWFFLIGALGFFPLFILESIARHSIASITIKGSIGIIYGAVLSSTFGYTLYSYGAKYIKANEIGIFTYLEPVATALVAIPLLHEEITFLYLLGSIFVFLGIFIAEAKLHYHPFHPMKSVNEHSPVLDSGP